MKDKSLNLYNDGKKYLAFLQFERRLSSNTISSYWLDLRSFFDYIATSYDIKKLSEIKSAHINTYIKSLDKYIDKQNHTVAKKSSSINRSISSIKSFYKYLINNEIIKENPAKSILSVKQSKKIPDILSVEEINKILDSFDLTKKNNIRDKAVISLLYSSGLRVSELTSLQLTNLFLEEDIIRIFGKGNKERIVPIGSIAKNDLLYYIENIRPHYTRKTNSKGILFLSNRGKELSRKTVWNIIRLSSIRAEINKKKTINQINISKGAFSLINPPINEPNKEKPPKYNAIL